MIRYKVVPLIVSIKSGAKDSIIAEEVEDIIEINANLGWTFYRIEEVNVEISPGCIGNLLGNKVSFIKKNLIVFKRDE